LGGGVGGGRTGGDSGAAWVARALDGDDSCEMPCPFWVGCQAGVHFGPGRAGEKAALYVRQSGLF
jgi:hypothetical protein